MSGLKIRRLGYALGAEISGVDLSAPLAPGVAARIRQAWLDHIVLCFPNQDLNPEQLDAFASHFGPVEKELQLLPPSQPGVLTVHELNNKPTPGVDRYAVADLWHTDRDFADDPTTVTFLLAKQLPAVGGNTMWANTYAAYETLSPKLQELLEPLEAMHASTGRNSLGGTSAQVQAEIQKNDPTAVHPIVRPHPVTGRKALYLGVRVRNIVGMSEEESAPLLDFLNRHTVRYEHVYRHRWSPGDLIVWDNGCSLHYAVRDYDPAQLRRMLRCTLE